MMETMPQSASDVVERYRERGYEVIAEPDASLLPNEAKSLRPDLLAVKGNEHVIVEIKREQNMLAYPALVRLADSIRRIPGWRLDIVVLPTPRTPSQAQPLSRDEFKRRLNTAERVAKETNDYAAALLLVWTAVEALVNHEMRQQGEQVLPSASRLPKVAYSMGLIDEQDVSTAEWLARVRNEVVHGASKLQVTASDYERAADFVRRLFRSNG
jgi:hypothetical protein